MRILSFLLVLLFAVEVHVADAGYTYSCWLNGWRKNANDSSADIFGVETTHFGFTLDVADFHKVGFGLLHDSSGYQQGLEHKADRLRELPSAELAIELNVEGVSYVAIACRAGQERGVKHLSSVRLWESGRYVQHYDFLELDFQNADGDQLLCEATLDVVAWPGSLTFNLDVAPESDLGETVMRLALSSQEGHWQREEEIETWQGKERKSLSLTCSAASTPSTEIAVTLNDGQQIPVRFDERKNCSVASVDRLKRDWPTGYTDIRQYDEFRIDVAGTGSDEPVPFLLDLRRPANVTGLCPILCDRQGRPTGIPVQLSKNWHDRSMGSYLMAYAMLPAKTDATYILRVVYGFYGTLPAASHAQLSLIGYGGNGRWDQLAIGCWGETICFDVDRSLVDLAITDIRMLMVRDGRDGKQWSWTNAGWGGDWLHVEDESQAKYFPTGMKTAYVAHGPCLTDARHHGYLGANQEVAFSSRVQTVRTDDYARTLMDFHYRFERDVAPRFVSLFKLGRTHGYHTPEIACGNLEGLLARWDVPEALEKGQVFLDNVELAGPAPYWVAFTGAAEAAVRKPKPNGYRSLIIRNYRVVAGGQEYTQPTIRAPVHASSPPNLDIELLPPPGLTTFRTGDVIELNVELITLPRVADDYYGPNDVFRQHLKENSTSWKTTHREAKGNRLDVSVSGGTEIENYPLVVEVQDPEVALTISGGVGAVPVRFQGLTSTHGWQLYRVVNGERVPFDQSVHGNDYWQTDFDATTETYALTFNLPLDAADISEWVLTH